MRKWSTLLNRELPTLIGYLTNLLRSTFWRNLSRAARRSIVLDLVWR